MSQVASEKDRPQGPEETKAHSGNIWGWKFSFYSLGFILFMVAFAAIRFWMLPEDKRSFAPIPEETVQDTLTQRN